MNRQELAFAGMGDVPVGRREGVSVTQRTLTGRENPISIPLVNTNPGRPEVKPVVLENAVGDVLYYGGAVLSEGASTGQDLFQVIKDHASFIFGLVGGFWALGKIKGLIRRVTQGSDY